MLMTIQIEKHSYMSLLSILSLKCMAQNVNEMHKNELYQALGCKKRKYVQDLLTLHMIKR